MWLGKSSDPVPHQSKSGIRIRLITSDLQNSVSWIRIWIQIRSVFSDPHKQKHEEKNSKMSEKIHRLTLEFSL